MINYNNPNQMNLQQPSNFVGQTQIPMQYPYGNNNMLLNNTPYDNYMGRSTNGSQNLLSNQFLKCRPVSSKEEAQAYQIDLDGSLWVFTDLGSDKIYTKQVNNDGTATFKTYIFTEDENPYTLTEYVTKEEFNKVVQNLMAAMQIPSSQEPVPPSANEKQNIMSF